MLQFNSERGQGMLEAAVIFAILVTIGYFLAPVVGKMLAGNNPQNVLSGG
jgi:hypothetical protein